MFYGINSKDLTGSLISQLQVVRDDVEFLNKVDKKADISDYPYLTKTANTVLLTPSGKLRIPEVERVERAGFDVCLIEGKIFFHRNDVQFRVPANTRGEITTTVDWRAGLCS